jgi:hypothetical protein
MLYICLYELFFWLQFKCFSRAIFHFGIFPTGLSLSILYISYISRSFFLSFFLAFSLSLSLSLSLYLSLPLSLALSVSLSLSLYPLSQLYLSISLLS